MKRRSKSNERGCEWGAQPEGSELEALRSELQRYRLELANREDNYNRVFAQFRPVHVDGGATLRTGPLPPQPVSASRGTTAHAETTWLRGPGSAAPFPPPLGRRALTMLDAWPAQSRRQNTNQGSVKISESSSAVEVHATEDGVRIGSENFPDQDKRVRFKCNLHEKKMHLHMLCSYQHN